MNPTSQAIINAQRKQYLKQLQATAAAFPEFKISEKYEMGYWPLPEDWKTSIPNTQRAKLSDRMDISYEAHYGLTLNLYRKGVSLDDLEKLSFDEKLDLAMTLPETHNKWPK